MHPEQRPRRADDEAREDRQGHRYCALARCDEEQDERWEDDHRVGRMRAGEAQRVGHHRVRVECRAGAMDDELDALDQQSPDRGDPDEPCGSTRVAPKVEDHRCRQAQSERCRRPSGVIQKQPCVGRPDTRRARRDPLADERDVERIAGSAAEPAGNCKGNEGGDCQAAKKFEPHRAIKRCFTTSRYAPLRPIVWMKAASRKIGTRDGRMCS